MSNDPVALERVARAICRARGIDPDACVMGSGGTPNVPSVCHIRAWQQEQAVARAALSAVPQAGVVEGFWLAPDEITEEMIRAVQERTNKGGIGWKETWRALRSAAPQPDNEAQQ